MNEAAANLSFELRDLSSALRRIQQRLHAETPPDPVALGEFRQVVDNVRFTAWGVSELINARQTKQRPESAQTFLAAERLRRFEQLVKDLCGDLDREVIKVQAGCGSKLLESLDALRSHLEAQLHRRPRALP